MTSHTAPKASRAELAHVSVPLMWPMLIAAQMTEKGLELYANNLKFLAEEEKLHHDLRPKLAKGTFVALGRQVDVRRITCPVYLLAGETDDITTSEQVFNAEKYLGTPKDQIWKQLVPGGHIGLFMGSRILKETWPTIASWVATRSASR
jgi:poly-beta-hydroxyalkanoate depolymerase